MILQNQSTVFVCLLLNVFQAIIRQAVSIYTSRPLKVSSGSFIRHVSRSGTGSGCAHNFFEVYLRACSDASKIYFDLLQNVQFTSNGLFYALPFCVFTPNPCDTCIIELRRLGNKNSHAFFYIFSCSATLLLVLLAFWFLCLLLS